MFVRRSLFASALVSVLLVGISTDAHAQYERPTLPIARLELGAGMSPFGVGNGLSLRTAIAVFPARVGVLARFTSHTSASGVRGDLLKLKSPQEHVVDRAIMVAGRVDMDVDAIFTVALGAGQLWGERLNDNNSGFVSLERRIGLATEIGAYMPTKHSGLGTVIMATATPHDFVVGFVLTFYVGI